jgi:hypothetical protein
MARMGIRLGEREGGDQGNKGGGQRPAHQNLLV